MNKLLSMPTDLPQEEPNGLIEEVMTKLKSAIIIYSLDSALGVGKDILDSLNILDQAQRLLSLKPRSSSISSISSLGSRIADYDKEFLYTYRWGLSRWTDLQESKADFQKWLEGGYKLPPKDATLNCWEATIVNLYLYNAFDKNELIGAFREGKKTTSPDGTAKCMESDSDIVSSFLGFFGAAHKVNRIEEVQPGDIVSFTSVEGTENAHVAVTFESGDSIKLASFWTIPQEKMVLISPNKLLAVCSEATTRSSRFEALDIHRIKISKKFRSFFQGLVD